MTYVWLAGVLNDRTDLALRVSQRALKNFEAAGVPESDPGRARCEKLRSKLLNQKEANEKALHEPHP